MVECSAARIPELELVLLIIMIQIVLCITPHEACFRQEFVLQRGHIGDGLMLVSAVLWTEGWKCEHSQDTRW